MEGYKVKEEDLKGQIEGFPIEVVQKMVERQIEQGNKPDITVFQKKNYAPSSLGGFSWSNTVENFDFWDDVINDENFYLFFENYPKK